MTKARSAPAELLAEELPRLLPGWLARQRWFGAKGRQITRISVVRAVTLSEGDPRLVHAVVSVAHSGIADRAAADGGTAERYQLVLGLGSTLPDFMAHARIGRLDGQVVFDATLDPDLAGVLLDLVAAGAERDGVHFRGEPGVAIRTGRTGRALASEQSNTSLVFGEDYILKLFRRLEPGRSPDLELHRALHSAGSAHIAELYGAIEGELDGRPVTYGMLSGLAAGAADGWAMATGSVRDLIAEADLPADEVGGDFASEAHRLGQAVADVHAALAEALGSTPLGRSELAADAAEMVDRLAETVRVVPELGEHAAPIRAAFEAVTELDIPLHVQRIHGDLHLGQVLRTIRGWLLIDFEGEPARALRHRLTPMSPLRDVAGMLRSFDYAAWFLLVEQPPDRQLEYRAREWSQRNRRAFCDGYATRAADPRDAAVLLRALELDKAVYEVAYEYGNRPTWLPIPLGSIARLVAEPVATPGPTPGGER